MASRKWKIALPAAGIVGAIALLVAVGIGDADGFAYYLTVDEFLQKRPGEAENFRVNGQVKEGSIVLDASGLSARFVITDGVRSMPVTYRGAVSDSLADGADVVIEGAMNDRGTFVADEMLAKCPSKYESEGDAHPEEVPRNLSASE